MLLVYFFDIEVLSELTVFIDIRTFRICGKMDNEVEVAKQTKIWGQ